MPRQVKLLAKFGPWRGGGLNDKDLPENLKPNEMQTATNLAILETGQMSPLNDLASSGSAIDVSGPLTAFVTDGASLNSSNWLAYADRRYVCISGDRTYYTSRGRMPRFWSPLENREIGVAPPTNVAVAVTAAGGTGTWGGSAGQIRAFALTWVDGQGNESNPQQYTLSVTHNATDRIVVTTGDWPAWAIEARVWMTNGILGTGPFYLIDEITDGATMVQYNTATPDTTQPLTWDVGGTAENADGLYVEDHSPCPPVTRLANAIYSTSGEGAANDTGRLFWAQDNILGCSLDGNHLYHPLTLRWTLPESIEAVVVFNNAVYALGTTRIWRAWDSGGTILIDQLDVAFGILDGFTAQVAEFGVLFVAREGLAVLDGSTVRIVTRERLLAATLRNLTIKATVYSDFEYKLFHSSGAYVFDFRNGLPPQITTTSLQVTAARFASFNPPLVGLARQDLTQARRKHGMAYTGTSVAVSGGSHITGGAETVLGNSMEYNLVHGGLIAGTTANLVEARMNAPLVAFSATLYTYGGLTTTMGMLSPIAMVSAPNVLERRFGGAWAAYVPAAGVGPGQKQGVGLAIDTSIYGKLYIHGGSTSADVTNGTSTLHSVDLLGGGTYAALTGSGVARTHAPLVYTFRSGLGSGSLFILGGYNTSSGFVDSLSVYSVAGDSWTTYTGLYATYGFAPRAYHAMWYDQNSDRIYIHGGIGSDGQALSDLWELDPALPSGQILKSSAANVELVGERWGHVGCEVFPATLADGEGVAAGRTISVAHITGGTSLSAAVEALHHRINPSCLVNNSTAADLFAVKSGESSVKTWNGGTQLAVTVKLPGIRNDRLLTVSKIRVLHTAGPATLKVSRDGAAMASVWSLSANAQVQERRVALRGSMLEFQLEASASPLRESWIEFWGYEHERGA